MNRKKQLPVVFIICITGCLMLACLGTTKTVEPWIPPTLEYSDTLYTPDINQPLIENSNPTASEDSNIQAEEIEHVTDISESSSTYIQEEYIVQPNDTLAGIADMFGINMEQLMSVNDITNPDLLYVGQSLKIPSENPVDTGPDFIIIPDSEFVYSPSAVNFDIAGFLDQYNGYLLKYTEELNHRTYTGLEILTKVATDYSINPRILIAVIEYQSGWITNSSKPGEQQLLYPLGYYDSQRKGFFSQLNWAAGALNNGYYTRKVSATNGWVLEDNTYIPLAPSINPGTAAIQSFMAELYGKSQWENAVSATGLYQTYVNFFGNPSNYAIEPLVPSNLTQPTLELPFEIGTTWSFTGGPHSAWGSGSAWGALDFAPPGEPLGCVVSDAWATSVADGLVVRSNEGSVLLDLDGDGLEQTGWVILYLHIDSYERVTSGTYVHTGDKIGHPSCEGGVSYGTHMHIARKYNGEWIPADQDVPFNLSGWISEGDGIEYNGYLRKGEQSIEAWDDYVAENQITH